jgi:L-serine dehydratase
MIFREIAVASTSKAIVDWVCWGSATVAENTTPRQNRLSVVERPAVFLPIGTHTLPLLAVTHSLFELFKIGIGPSSSHTMGPMRAALRFVNELEATGLALQTASVQVDLYGSLALTGHGHGTDRAVLLGLSGYTPEGVDPAEIEAVLAAIRAAGKLQLPGQHTIVFHETKDLIFHRDQMYPVAAVASHPNGMRFSAFDQSGALLAERIFFSIGGGFILSEQERVAAQTLGDDQAREVPYPFHSAQELLERAAANQLTIAQLMLANECVLLEGAEQAVVDRILRIWQVMRECTQRGMSAEGILPGGLKVRRRARKLAERLRTNGPKDPLSQLDWTTVYAMAVNEENAAGGRVVTAPTNGAAGVIPAVAHYYLEFVEGADESGIIRYFLTAAAIGILYKENASISGAEVGCQGEVGVACSMAAAGLVAAINGPHQTRLSPAEINARLEHAAEIGMEHHLGMTCDPIGGLVQVPCIERNAVGAIKAINASRMAMNESEGHKVSLDQVIKTMYQTGLDMQARYKETSLAGLALNVIEC